MKKVINYESMSVQEKWNVLAAVANLYYNSDLTQNQIAERFYTSRSKISRMLKEARELGIVEINIREPWERKLELEKKLKEEFHLNNIRVVAIKEENPIRGLQKIGEAAAYYLDSIIKKDMILGISWGNTLYHLVKYIAANNKKNIPFTVVPIMGAASINKPEMDALDLSKELASSYGGKYHYIYAPLYVKSKELRENLIQEDNIKEPLSLAKNADVILTSVGSITHKTWLDFLQPQSLEVLEARGAVGHIGGHFYDMDGQEIKTSLIDKMIGISLSDMKTCKEVVCVAYKEKKSEAVLGALKGGFVDTLIVDEFCADGILKLM